jgi:hypothetical protein
MLTLKRTIKVVLLLRASTAAPAQSAPTSSLTIISWKSPGIWRSRPTPPWGFPRAAQSFYAAPWMEIEYGVTAGWTAELYLEGQETAGDNAVFTGWRLENRFRPLQREHWINQCSTWSTSFALNGLGSPRLIRPGHEIHGFWQPTGSAFPREAPMRGPLAATFFAISLGVLAARSQNIRYRQDPNWNPPASAAAKQISSPTDPRLRLEARSSFIETLSSVTGKMAAVSQETRR